MHFTVTGNNLRPDMVQRAVELSHTKYCSASAMLEKTAVMTFSVEIATEARGQIEPNVAI
jgi:putative redox protein